MSTRSVRFFGLLLMAAIAAAAGQSCGSEQPTQYDNFVAAAARADTEGWKPYWLGRSFTAGGLTFRGPGIGDFGEPIEGGGTGYSYDAKIGSAGVELDLYVYSPSAWAAAEEIGRTRGPLGATIRDVKLAGYDAKLYVAKSAKQNPDGVRADIDIDGVVVRVQAGSVQAPGGANLNPLTDEATFLAVMQNLRPYPQ